MSVNIFYTCVREDLLTFLFFIIVLLLGNTIGFLAQRNQKFLVVITKKQNKKKPYLPAPCNGFVQSRTETT